ncbi:reverse transcriptase domain-containing protein [Tanacetum coccineum]
MESPGNRLKPSSVEPAKLKLKELPENLEYAFLQENDQLLVVISSVLSTDGKNRLLEVLQNHKGFMGKPCPGYPEEGGMTIVKNEKDELIPQRTVTGWRVCIDYRKLNNATQKDHFPLPFIDQMLERLAGHEYYCFLDGFFGYSQIPIAPEDQEKTTFTCPYGTFAYKQMPFELCNAPATFQRCMTAIFHELIEDNMEVFMDDLSVFGSSFDHCLKNLEKMLKSDYAVGAVLGQRINKHFKPIHYASKIMKEAQENYTSTEKELQAVVFAFDKFRQYPVLSKTIIRDKKGAENLAVDQLSRLKHPDLGKLTRAEIRDLFLEEQLMSISDMNNKPWYWKRIFRKRLKTKPKMTKPSTEWKRPSQIEAKVSQSQKVNRTRPSYSNSVLTESYEDVWPEMKQHKFFDNVTADHSEDIMASPPPQGKSSRSGFTGHISFAMRANWFKSAMHVSWPETFPRETKHLKITSKSVKYSMFGG